MSTPFLKWAGGKTQLLPEITAIVDSMRDSSESFIYVEPFVGGGSVLFNLLDNCSNLKFAIINDMNRDLMNCYRIIADNDKYIHLKNRLLEIETEYNHKTYDEKKQMYSDIRDEYNKRNSSDIVDPVEISAMFIFLNKCGFNGMYRENKSGEYNIPWGQKDYINLFDEYNFDRCHVLLNEKVVILDGDYSKTGVAFDLARVNGTDLIFYIDPPYRPVSASSSFTSYVSGGFGDKEQEELKMFCDNIDSFGGKFIVSNSKSEDFFDKLYSGYHIDVVEARRNINSIGSKRGKVEEILIYNEEKKSNALF